MQLPQIETIAAVSIDTTLTNDLRDMAQIFVGNEVAPGWFGWAIPLADGSNRIGIGCDSKHTSIKPRVLLEQLLHRFPEQLSGAKMENFSGGFIPLYKNTDHYHESISDNVMLVGDAAGQVKPTSGGGIYTGLRAAESAAQVAIMAMNEGDFSSTSLRRYEDKWHADLEDELGCGGDVREMFLTLNDKQLQRVVQFLGLPGLRNIIDRYGDIDYQSNVFAQLVRVAPTLKSMLALPSILPDRWLKMLASDSNEPSA
jgi:flavin-dependent dehydrogenase